MDYADVGFFGARYLLAHFADRLKERFEFETLPTTDLELIEAIGRKHGCLGKNGLVDLDRASRILINSLRTGALGRLTFETPAMMEQEIELTATAIEDKAESAKAKDAQRKKRFIDRQRTKVKSRTQKGT